MPEWRPWDCASNRSGLLFPLPLYLFSPADSLDTAGGTRTPREPPGRRTESGEGKPLPRVLSPAGGAYFPASKRHRRPGANPEPLLRERFGVSFRFTVHAAETDHNRREIPPIPPRCCHTFVLLHTRMNSYLFCVLTVCFGLKNKEIPCAGLRRAGNGTIPQGRRKKMFFFGIRGEKQA